MLPKLPFDCDVGYDTHVEKDPSKTSGLLPILECLQENSVDVCLRCERVMLEGEERGFNILSR